MSKQFDQMTVAQLAAMLADAKQNCSHPKLLAWDVPEAIQDCQDCSGTGQVYVLPDTVREPCPGSDALLISGRWVEGVYIHDPYCHCRGLGYVPSVSLEVWVGARRQLHLRHARLPDGLGITHHLLKTTEWWVATYPCSSIGEHQHERSYRPEEDTCAKGEGLEPLDAVLRALAAALEAQERMI